MSQPNSGQHPDDQGPDAQGPDGRGVDGQGHPGQDPEVGTARITGRKWGGVGGFLIGWRLSWAFLVITLISAYNVSPESFPTSWAVGAALVLLAPALFFLSPRRRTWFFIGLAAGSIVMGGMCLSLTTSNL